MTPTGADGGEADDPIPLSALQHAVYCLRQAALIHLERLWVENRFTAEGRVVHASTDEPGARKRGAIRRVTALPISCRRLKVAGVADLVEFRAGGGRETPYPVEFKRGSPKVHRADEVQLCAQGLCLEEMTGQPVPEGALFYAEIRRRVVVTFDSDLRRLTEDTAAALRQVFETGNTPPAEYVHAKCRACSLTDVCLPKAGTRSVRAWRERAIVSALADEDSV